MNCPVSWCLQTTPHAIHQSVVVTVPSGGRWNISLGLIDGSEHPYVTVYYVAEVRAADMHLSLSMADAPDYAAFAARLSEDGTGAVIASAISRFAALAGELAHV